MFDWLLFWRRPPTTGEAFFPILGDILNKEIARMEDKQMLLAKDSAKYIDKAREFMQSDDYKAAIQCLKQNILHQQQLDRVENDLKRIRNKLYRWTIFMKMLSEAYALKSRTSELMSMSNEGNMDGRDKATVDVFEILKNIKEIQAEILASDSASARSDEAELEAELEQLMCEVADEDGVAALPAVTAL